jgi:hypothetical protein
MIEPEDINEEQDDDKKRIYHETEDNEQDQDQGDSSSASDVGRTDFIKKPGRTTSPLGSGHEPGTTPGGIGT